MHIRNIQLKKADEVKKEKEKAERGGGLALIKPDLVKELNATGKL